MASRYQVFISHAGEDKQTVAIPLYNVLKGRGIQVFLDEPELPGGEIAPDNMVQNMETTPIGVFILRPEFLAKKWTMKELLCFQRRVEEAMHRDEQPPLLIPVFYGMTVNDCGDQEIFGSKDENGENVFWKWGFFKRMGKSETSMEVVLQAVQKLSKHTGVVNSDNASNADSNEMAGKRAALVIKIADMVEKAVQKLSFRNGAGSSRAQITSDLSGRTDSYKPCFLVPCLPPHIILDFETRDSNGNYVTVEGRFKDKLWSTIRCNDVSGAIAVGKTSDGVPGLTGMGGVGKSVSLIALGYEADIRDEFKDGIYFLPLGEQADAAHVIEKLARIVHNCGGQYIAKQIREADSVESAVDEAAMWFKGKRVLFLLDDVWQSESNPLGFFEELERLVSAEGRIAVTTRNKDIAEAAGCPVYFSPREPQGTESRAMLFEYAGLKSHSTRSDACNDAVGRTLAHCAGLPLALGIAGRAISQRLAEGDVDCRGAISWYAEKIGAGEDGLVHETLGRYKTTLREAVDTSLDTADKWGQSDRTVRRFGKKLVLSELYARLSVLRKQARVPQSMLSKLWELEDMELVAAVVNKLAILNLLFTGERIGVHDLLLDVCVHEAEKKGMIQSYHEMLLGAYNCPGDVDDAEMVMPVLEGEENFGSSVDIEKDTLRPYKRLKHSQGASISNCNEHDVMRKWWKEDLDKDGYVEENLARHLVASGNVMELRKLLCDARWTGHRVKAGNVLAWEGDFAELLSGMEVAVNGNMNWGKQEELKRGLKAVRDTVMVSWSFMIHNPYELAFQVIGRLRGLEGNLTIVGEYLKSVEQSAKKPWLKPLKRCLRSPEGPLKMELALKWDIRAIAISPTKPRAFVGVGSKIVVVELERRKVIMELTGPFTIVGGDKVTCVGISTDGRCVVAGWTDGRLCMWDANTGIGIGQVRQGHDGPVTCVAINSAKEEVVSGSDDNTLRFWDMKTMTQVGEAYKVDCVAITPDGNRIVTGCDDVSCVAITADGTWIVSSWNDNTLRVWDRQTMSQVGMAPVGHSGVSCVAISTDGTRIVAGSNDGTLRIWDLQTMTQVGEALKGHSSRVRCVAITSDGKRILSGSGDNMFRVWEVQTMSQVGEALKRHSDWVHRVAISPDARYIVSTSYDSKAMVWKIETGEPIGEEVGVSYSYSLTVQISEGNIVAFGIEGYGDAIFRIDERLGLVFLRNSQGRANDLYGGSIEEGGGIAPVTCNFGWVWLQYPRRQLLATFTDLIRSFAFHKSSKILALGHNSGAVSFHKLIE